VGNEEPTLHYRPVTFSTFWLEHQLVGLEPAEPRPVLNRAAHPLYRWTQIALHALNAALIMLVLRALGVPFLASLLVGAGFALHPVNVASVAWLSERKNLLSGALFWLALLLHVEHRRAAPSALPWRYALGLLVFALALLAKVAALVLAQLLIVTDRLLDGRWSRAALARAAPFFALGLLAALQTTAREAFIANTWEPIALHLRPLIASSALVHYVSKTSLPLELALIYPRWPESLAVPGYWLALISVAGVSALIWRRRRRLGERWLWGLTLFLVGVAPVLGLKHFVWMDFAFASDHYMYFSLPGLLLLAALPLERWTRARASEPPELRFGAYAKSRLLLLVAGSGLALGVCAARTIQQSATWRDDATLWTHTLSVSPDCVIAHLSLGHHHVRRGDLPRALDHYQQVPRVKPSLVKGWRLTAQAAAELGRVEQALAYYEDGVKVQEGKSPRAWSLRMRLAEYLFKLGRFDEARLHYQVVLSKGPGPKATRYLEERIRSLR